MKWIYFDDEAKCFLPTEYAKEICGLSTTEDLSDHVEVESQTGADSNDEDSTTEEMEIIADTPRTMSFAPSYSQGASDESTRASTPTENCAEDVPADMKNQKPLKQEDIADDVTMKDVSGDRKPPAGAADELGNLKVVSWPSGTVIDPGSSPWKEGKTKEATVDIVSDPQKLGNLLRLNDPNSPEFYEQ